MKEISIIVPTFKRDCRLLSNCLDSLLNQKINKDKYEVIVVDDNENSSIYRENNILLINKYKELYKEFNLKLILNKSNQGGALSRNIGVANASAHFVTFLDDDDIYLEDKLINQINYIKDNNFDMIFSNLLIKNKEKVIDKREYTWLKNYNNNYLLKMHLIKHITGTPTFMYKREKFLEIKGFPDVKMGQEFYLMLNTIKSGLEIGYLNKNDVIAYVHDGERISNGPNKIKGEKHLFKTKMEYKEILKNKEINYIKMRHHAVLAATYFRGERFLVCLIEIFKSILSDPLSFIIEVVKLMNKRKRN